MKFLATQQISKDDLARQGDLPGWINDFISLLNTFIVNVIQCLQGGLTFSDNFLGKEVTLTFTHGVAQKWSPDAGKTIKGIVLIDPAGQIVTGFGFTRNSDGSVQITVNFQSGSGTQAQCLFQAQYR